MKKKALLLFAAALAVIGLMFFVPAGTLDYWQAWAYIAVVFIPASLVISYFLDKDPEFLERRMKLKEKEAKQQLVVKLAGILFVIGFLIPGLDHRFGWSNVPFGLVAAADACVLIGYIICFLVFRENSYAGRTIEVVKGQKVISTGPYSIIRHPMYLGVLLLYVATPIALGSYWALPPFLLVVPVILFRILNEEEVLRRELAGYKEYCKKTRYRLLPFIW
ncbi:MAG: isoprenylcysteine carboxylmethyltransferase family protein [Candidatus ainarchaeum sp.]|nr:isoprenylcysteine carboxylmethyltransferase family protein [Candidatus ainarchaeum sp.]